MKLLVFTQKIDRNDPVLGFFHGWVVELSKHTESVSVICLGKGEFDLPSNVSVYSLGEERGVSKIGYVLNLYKYLGVISGSYDRVFVHMNQEYVLLAGLYWKIKNIPVYLWRNHPKGNILTYIAVFFSTKVFCTSNLSFTAQFKKSVIMPAGVDTRIFKIKPETMRKKYSVCMVGRVSPVKHIDLGLEAVKILTSQGVQVSFDIVGPVLEKDLPYFNSLKKYIAEHDLSKIVHFGEAVSPEKLPDIYNGYEICLNLTDSGSFDKTVVEASSCGTVPLVSNLSFENILPEVCLTKNTPEAVAEAIQRLLDPQQQIKIQKDLAFFAESQSLISLVAKLKLEIA